VAASGSRCYNYGPFHPGDSPNPTNPPPPRGPVSALVVGDGGGPEHPGQDIAVIPAQGIGRKSLAVESLSGHMEPKRAGRKSIFAALSGAADHMFAAVVMTPAEARLQKLADLELEFEASCRSQSTASHHVSNYSAVPTQSTASDSHPDQPEVKMCAENANDAQPVVQAALEAKKRVQMCVEDSDDSDAPEPTAGSGSKGLSVFHGTDAQAAVFQRCQMMEAAAATQAENRKAAGATRYTMADGQVVDIEDVTWLQRMVHGHVFEMFFGFLIMTNSIFMGVEVDYTANNPTSDSPLSFYVVNYLYTFFFTVELFIRVSADRLSYCQGGCKKQMWNALDVIIVVSSLFEVVLDGMKFMRDAEDEDGGGVNVSNLRIVRIIRISKLMRLFRIGRIMKFVRSLRTLIISIIHTLKSVFWSLLLLTIIIYVFAIIFAQAVSDYNVSVIFNVVPDGFSSNEREQLLYHWGTLPDAMLSLFMSISGGVSWIDVVKPLRLLNTIWLFIFLCFIGFVYFAVLNVVTGVFCQSAIESTQQDQESMVQAFISNKNLYTTRFKNLFSELDAEDTGIITRDEFEEHINDDRVQAYFGTLGLEAQDAIRLFETLDMSDADEVGIDIEDFVDGCLRLKGTAKSCDLARLLYENKTIMRELVDFIEFAEEQFSQILGETKKLSHSHSKQRHAGRRSGIGGEVGGVHQAPPLMSGRSFA